jgi:acyl-CoA thioester hydrolase, YbgC/YbaW family
MALIQVREKVRFVETDMMGVVHHSNYLRWFEMARVEYLRSAGIELLDLMNDGIVFPITKVECKYSASAVFDDWLLINVVMVSFNKAKMEFAYQVFREKDGKLLTEGFTQNLFTNSSGVITRLPDRYFERLKEVASQDQPLPLWVKIMKGSV